jgi:hypothetical protein
MGLTRISIQTNLGRLHIFAHWLRAQGWVYQYDWWYTVGQYDEHRDENKVIFLFPDPKHASIFALKWV